MDTGQTKGNAESNVVIQHRRLQRSFADGLIAEQIGDLWEPWMRQIDDALKSKLKQEHGG